MNAHRTATDLRSISFPEKDEPLRRDVHLLGSIVGEVVEEQAGRTRFEQVEAARVSAIARREGDTRAGADLDQHMSGLEPSEASELARAFSTYFQAVNLAEQVHRVRRGRTYLRAGEAQDGSTLATVRVLAERGLDRATVSELIGRILVEPVFTAHPTEATRRIILEKQRRVAERLIERLDPSRTPRDERSLLARIRTELTTAWQTEEHPGQRPRVRDETEHVLFYMSEVLYDVAPVLAEVIDEALDDTFGAPDGEGRGVVASLPVRFASWVGGDMDGNPNVGADTLLETLRRHREVILELYVRDLRSLARRLSQSRPEVEVSEELASLRADLEVRFPETAEGVPPRQRNMPYRIALSLVAARLEATAADGERGYAGPADLVDDLLTVEESLRTKKGRHAGLWQVRRLRRRVEVFGFHFATLDVRQDGREYRDLMAELLDDPEWPGRPADDRVDRLDRLLREEIDSGEAGLSERAVHALEVFRAIGEARRRFGPDAVGPFIVSMARDLGDVLTVLYLARRAGLAAADGTVPLDVAPLLETVPDLERAGPVLRALLDDPVYGPHLTRRGSPQMVMVGYSDSSKDGGLFASRWSLHDAQSALAGVAEEGDVALTIFHGRGGTVSRGGGKAENALRSAPRGSVSHHLRLTEQGEVIDTKYGLPGIALRELERMVGAVALHHTVEPEEVPEDWREAAGAVAVASRARYRKLVYEDPGFHDFFRQVTPVDVIERMAIGSRPASRRAGEGIEDLRAIPWVFAWTQNRILVPGWYGLGSGLEAAVDRLGEAEAARMVRSWSFMRVLLDDVEMVLAKSDLDIGARYVERLSDAPGSELFSRIREEFERTVELVERLGGASELLEGEPTLRRSIRLRNPYVDPLSYMQIDLLDRWRAAGRSEGPLCDALLETVQGIARGLKNTG